MFRKRSKETGSLSSKSGSPDLKSDPDSDPVSKRNHRKLLYYNDPHLRETFYSHLFTLRLAWTVFSVVGLALGFAPIQTPMLTLFGFAMTGFASTFIQSGREYQRSAMRMARYLEGYKFDMTLAAKCEFFDNLMGAGLYSVFLGLGQAIAIFISVKFNFRIPIKTIFFAVGSSVVYILLPLILSFGLLFLCSRRVLGFSKEGNLYEGMASFRPKVVLRSLKQRSHLLGS